MNLTDNITAQEVLPKETWDKYGSTAVRLIDPRITMANQLIRERQGTPRYFNTWNLNHWSNRNWSGLRTPGSKYYNELSQHSYGRALDSISDAVPHEETWQDILDNPEWYWEAGVTVVESIKMAPTWLHTDCRGFDYEGWEIIELMIADKEDGKWLLRTVEEWKGLNLKETGDHLGI